MNDKTNLFERTQQAAIEYFELKKKFENSIIDTVKKFRKQCLIAWLELYQEYKNKYATFKNVNVGIPALIQLCNNTIDTDIEKLKKGRTSPYFNFKWNISVYCFIHTDNEFCDSEYYDDVKISLDYDDESFVIKLSKTNILDPVVFDQEVEKFKQETIAYFDKSYNYYQQRCKQQIEYWQTKLNC